MPQVSTILLPNKHWLAFSLSWWCNGKSLDVNAEGPEFNSRPGNSELLQFGFHQLMSIRLRNKESSIYKMCPKGLQYFCLIYINVCHWYKQPYLCNSQKEKCTTCKELQPYNIQTNECVQKIQNISTFQ